MRHMTEIAVISLLAFSSIAGACPLEGVWEVDHVRSAANYLDSKHRIDDEEEADIGAMTSVQWQFTCAMSILRTRSDDSQIFQFSSESPYTWKEIGASQILISETNEDGTETSFPVKLIEDVCFSFYHPVHFYDQIWCKLQ